MMMKKPPMKPMHPKEHDAMHGPVAVPAKKKSKKAKRAY